MANFEINDFSISRNRITFGDDLNVKFAILNTLGSGKTIKEVTVRLYAKAAGSDRYDLAVAQFAYNMPVSIANNKSKAFDFTAKVPAAEELPALWAAVSADPSIRALEIALHVGVDYIQSGTSYGASVAYELSHLIENPVFFLRSRCAPTITEFRLQRAISGVASDEGENLISTVKLDMADTAEASNMALTLLYEQGASVNQASARMDLTAHIPDLLAGVTDSATLIESLFTNSSDWDFKLVFGDAYEESVAYASIARAFANVHMSGKSTGGVCLGGFSSSEEGDPKFESYYKAHMYGGIHGVTDYAETEQQTYGTWIDGRPIYRKTQIIDVTSAGTAATGEMINIYLQSVVDLKGTFYRTGNDRWYPISFDYSDSSYIDAWVANYAVNVRAAWAGVAYVTVFYTKSTDEPGTVPALIDSSGSTLADSDGSTLADSDGSTLAAAAAADVYYLSHTGAQVDAAVTQANELYGLYTAGELKGDPGKDGKSAYQYALDGGYTGTEEEFASKLATEYQPKGDYALKSEFADYILERGVTNGWNWEKWNSGKYICWGLFRDTRTHYTTVNGFYGYYSSDFRYPITFPEAPIVHFNCKVGSGFAAPAGDVAMSTVQARCYALSTASGEVACAWELYVVGRWE